MSSNHSAGDSDWIVLFDGTSLDGWRNYRKPDLSPNWCIEDGCLTHYPRGGDILYGADTFADFELVLEWKIAPGGNSGIIYRVSEEFDAPCWHTGIEYQILDDDAHPNAGAAHLAGSLYDLYAPCCSVVKPAGEWNEARIIADGPHIEHWMNGTRLLTAEIGSDDWNRRVQASKFAKLPFAKFPGGYIVLQDHNSRVWYRNIRVRRLG